MSVLTTTELILEPWPLRPDRPMAPSRVTVSRLKGAIDRVAALGGLVMCSWLFALIAIAIKLDSPGPVFFTQTRLGRDKKPFTIYKFRTMVSDADAQGHDLRHRQRISGILFKDEDDPRLTRVGRFLRRTSLDELPQLINIWRREMSLVGPRPLPLEDTRYYEDWQWGRLAVLPGLTGLWQVSGRSRLSAEQMVRLDLHYIQRWSLALEFSIILKTFVVLATRDGAY